MSKNPSPSGRLQGQTVLVTGTTKGGIGYETARLLGDEGATVLTHGRTQEAAGASVGSLTVDGNGAGTFIPVAADLSSIAGAQELADAARAAAPHGIHGLVNNAGAGFNERRLSPDGFEMTMAINHVAVAALKALSDDGKLKPSIVADAITKYEIDPEAPIPTSV